MGNNKEQPSRDLSVKQKESPFTGHKLLLDGQQRLTSLTSVIKGEPIKVKDKKKPIAILFNLEHPDNLFEFTEIDYDTDSPYSNGDEEEYDNDSDEDLTLQERLKQLTFVVGSKTLAQQKNWVSVTQIFKSQSDSEILKSAGILSFDDPRYEKYSTRLKKVRSIFSQIRKEKISKENEKYLLYWLYIANMKGRYSRGSSETILDADLNVIKKGGGPKELIDLLYQQFGRLDADIPDFIGRGAGSPLFSIVFLALKKNGAKDWYTGLGLSLTHQGRYHYIQYHHIFPKSLLKKNYEKSEINEIANMAFISGRTNRNIGNKEPKEYFINIIKERSEEAILKQAVPIEKDLLEISNFRKFLEKRREMLKDLVNRFLKDALA